MFEFGIETGLPANATLLLTVGIEIYPIKIIDNNLKFAVL